MSSSLLQTQFVTVYLCIPKSRKSSLKDFFRKGIKHVDKLLTNCPVFLNKQLAMQYSRFTAYPHAILKLYVPESAIVADEWGLSLKHGVVSKQNIHGYFPSPAPDELYQLNPRFNQQNLESTCFPC